MIKRSQQRDVRMAVALLFVALSLHNLEEALTYGRYRARSQALLERILQVPIEVPSTTSFQMMLLALTVAAAVLTLWVQYSGSSRWPRRAVLAFAAILLANVLAPHLPAAVLLGGYAPGLITAVVLNAPLAIIVLARLSRGRE